MANDFNSVLATCQRFQDIATWDAEHFNANGALARIAELHKNELAAVSAERDEWQKQALEENAALDVARAELTAKDAEIARIKQEVENGIGDFANAVSGIVKRDALINELADALNLAASHTCYTSPVNVSNFRKLVSKAREIAK